MRKPNHVIAKYAQHWGVKDGEIVEVMNFDPANLTRALDGKRGMSNWSAIYVAGSVIYVAASKQQIPQDEVESFLKELRAAVLEESLATDPSRRRGAGKRRE